MTARLLQANCVRDKFLHQGLLALEARGAKDTPLLSKDAVRQVLPRILACTNELSSSIKKLTENAEGKVIISGIVSDFLVKVLVEAVLGYDETEKAIDVKQFSNYFSQAFVNDNPDSPLAAFPMIYPSLVPLDKFVLKPKAAKYFTSLLLCKVQEKANAEKKDRQPDLMDLLLELHQASKKKDSEEESKNEENVLETKEFVFVQSLAVLLNASLTARSLTTMGTVMLGANPELQERLHAELYQKLEASDEFDLVHNSEYLDMFISEVLRLYPVEFRLERECCETLELENAKIEKGMIVTIPTYALHRQTQIYEEPEKFNPERFSRDNKEARDLFAFLPYGQAGNSTANISIQWSVLVAKLAIAALVKKFKFSPAEGAKLPPTFEPGVTGVPILQPQTVVAESRK
ncbi:Cytochrome P450 9e2 [Gryllus bimaculatus]|nr:Cytochrome P450 9e2 [Gryllus bimaculatus]